MSASGRRQRSPLWPTWGRIALGRIVQTENICAERYGPAGCGAALCQISVCSASSKRILNVDPQVPDGVLDLGVTRAGSGSLEDCPSPCRSSRPWCAEANACRSPRAVVRLLLPTRPPAGHTDECSDDRRDRLDLERRSHRLFHLCAQAKQSRLARTSVVISNCTRTTGLLLDDHGTGSNLYEP